MAALVASALLLASCGSQYAGSTVAEQVHSWVTTSPDPKFGEVVAELQHDLHSIDETERTGTGVLLRTECDVLVTDSLSANQNLPTPDAELTTILSRAYSSALEAGRDCFCAAGGTPCPRGRSTRANLLRSSAGEASASEHGFIAAQARVDMFSLQSRAGPR